jgi:hypothetical protein
MYHIGYNFPEKLLRNSCINNQHYTLTCTTHLFYTLAPTFFGSSLSSSGSFLDPPELHEIQIEWVVYHKMCASLSWFLKEPRQSGTQAT